MEEYKIKEDIVLEDVIVVYRDEEYIKINTRKKTSL